MLESLSVIAQTIHGYGITLDNRVPEARVLHTPDELAGRAAPEGESLWDSATDLLQRNRAAQIAHQESAPHLPARHSALGNAGSSGCASSIQR